MSKDLLELFAIVNSINITEQQLYGILNTLSVSYAFLSDHHENYNDIVLSRKVSEQSSNLFSYFLATTLHNKF